ncbi:MAG: DUF3822 family protein [Prolixibacteraceae bacterium]|nr:DUF3822 family protein [Prolixibacteraceae bacterium]
MEHFLTDDLFHQENTKEYILSIQVSLGGFSFSVVLASENRLLAWKKVPLTITDGKFLSRHFQEWITQEELLKNEFREVKFIFDTTEFVLVPEQYFDETVKAKYMEMFFNLESETEIVASKIENQNAWLLFTLPKPLQENLQARFPHTEIVHPLKNCIENFPSIEAEKKRLIILFSSTYFYTVLFSGQNLLLANSFELKHKNDIIFYTLSILKQFDIVPSKTDVFIAGELPQGEETIAEIGKYFLPVQFLKPSRQLQVNSDIFTVPDYELYNLLNSI